MDRDVILHMISVYANFSLFANLIKQLSRELVLQSYAVVS